MEFSKNLKRIRTDKKMNQDELAIKINVSQRTVSAWEVGRSTPSVDDLPTIAAALGCEPGDLCGYRTVGNITLDDLLAKIYSLDKYDLYKLKDVIDEQIKKMESLAMLEHQKQELEEKQAEQEKMLKAYTDQIAALKNQIKNQK